MSLLTKIMLTLAAASTIPFLVGVVWGIIVQFDDDSNYFTSIAIGILMFVVPCLYFLVYILSVKFIGLFKLIVELWRN